MGYPDWVRSQGVGGVVRDVGWLVVPAVCLVALMVFVGHLVTDADIGAGDVHPGDLEHGGDPVQLALDRWGAGWVRCVPASWASLTGPW